jgi:hypothetical protein
VESKSALATKSGKAASTENINSRSLSQNLLKGKDTASQHNLLFARLQSQFKNSLPSLLKLDFAKKNGKTTPHDSDVELTLTDREISEIKRTWKIVIAERDTHNVKFDKLFGDELYELWGELCPDLQINEATKKATVMTTMFSDLVCHLEDKQKFRNQLEAFKKTEKEGLGMDQTSLATFAEALVGVVKQRIGFKECTPDIGHAWNNFAIMVVNGLQ